METDEFEFELTPFRIDSYRNFLMFGYPFIGGWTPKLSFDTIIEYDNVLEPTKKFKYRVFIAEWFIKGYMFVYKIEESDMFGGGV